MNLAGALLAVTLTVSPSSDTLELFTLFPPALETHPTNADRAFVGISSNGPGVFQLRTAPAQSLDYVNPSYMLPSDLSCSGQPFNVPNVGGFTLERNSGKTRGWLTTSSCELLVPFDYTTGGELNVVYGGVTRGEVPMRFTLTGSFTRYQNGGGGASIPSFGTNFTAAALRVGNRLLVATSNLQTPGSSPVYNPGTVLFFALDDSGATTTVMPASPFYAVTSDPNPLALTDLGGGRVAVTNAGISDASFPPLVTGKGSIDVLEAATGKLVGSFPLGLGNPGGRGLALDPTGSVAVAGSQTYRRLYAVDIRGIAALAASDVDPRLQRPSCNDVAGDSAGGVACLRTRVIRGGANPIVLPPPPGSSGVFSYVPQVRFGASGDFVVATSFNDGGLALAAFDPRNLAAGLPLLASRFGPPQTLAATGPAGVIGQECCPGPMILRASASGTLPGTSVVFATASPNAFAVRGHLSGTLTAPSGDADGDGVQDALDDCPVEPNAAQTDSGGLGSSNADGVGDVCQCGDVSNDGRVTSADVDALRVFLTGAGTLAAPQKCDVGKGATSGACNVLDATLLRRALALAAPGIEPVCAPFLP